MNNILSRLVGDKKDWKRMEARAAALPADYRTVYGEMKSYMWRFTAGDGMDIVEVSPPYDHAETTAMAANRAALEAISALAVRRRDGTATRWPGIADPSKG